MRQRRADGSVLEDETQLGAVNREVAVVLDQSQLAELVHEIVHAGSRRPYHLGQRLLRQLRQRLSGVPGLVVPAEEQQRTGESLLARVEHLIDQVFFDADIARENACEESVRELGVLVQGAAHLRAWNLNDGTWFDRGGSAHP